MKLLIIQFGRIGDLILMTSAIKAVKKKYPDSENDIITGRNNYQVLIDNQKINNINIFNKSHFKLIKTISKISKLK